MIRLEVQLRRSTITNGVVIVEGAGARNISDIIVKDRTLDVRWKIRIISGNILIEPTFEQYQGEPVIADSIIPDTRYRMGFDSGVPVFSNTDEPLGGQVVLQDSYENTKFYELRVDNTFEGLGLTNHFLNSDVLAGFTISERFNFSRNTVVIGTFNFFSIGTISTFGISGGEINVKAVNRMGQPVNQRITVEVNVPVRFIQQHGKVKSFKTGDDKIRKTIMLAEPELDLLENDLVYDYTGNLDSVNSIVLQDHNSDLKWKVSITDGNILVEETTEDSREDPVVTDSQNPSDKYSLGFYDGIPQFSVSVGAPETLVLQDVSEVTDFYELRADNSAPGVGLTNLFVETSPIGIVEFQEKIFDFAGITHHTEAIITDY